MVIKKIWNTIGPIVLSAISIFTIFIILQPFALWLTPSFDLLSSRNAGKITFITIIILTILLFVLIQSQSFLNKFLEKSILFFKEKNWIKRFFTYFALFFSLHALVLVIFLILGYIQFNPNYNTFTFKLFLKTLFGFITVFFLAWSEETIFRATIFQYFNINFSKLVSLFCASAIFAIVHDLHNPLNLVTKNWKLGLGLFLFGFMINAIFIYTDKLYTGMGAHAGIVFVKVLQRRFLFLKALPETQVPFWFNFDLRQAPIAHLFFLITALIFIYLSKEKLFLKLNNKN